MCLRICRKGEVSVAKKKKLCAFESEESELGVDAGVNATLQSDTQLAIGVAESAARVRFRLS